MLIIESMRYHLAPEKRLTMKSIRTRPRRSTLGSLYCLGGIDNVKSKHNKKRCFDRFNLKIRFSNYRTV
jgi:kelch-like protein 1/4/5